MDVTPQALEAAYTFLRGIVPQFRTLPPAEEVEFHVTRHQDRYADYSQWINCRDGAHILRVSSEKHEHLATLLQSVAHEMVHMKQSIEKTTTRAVHNRDFRRTGAAISALLGWDGKAF